MTTVPDTDATPDFENPPRHLPDRAGDHPRRPASSHARSTPTASVDDRRAARSPGEVAA